MSTQVEKRKQAEKQARFDAVVAQAERADDKAGDEHRRMAAHAHVMTHHALEMDTPEAHKAAAMAHTKVAEMHDEAAEAYTDEDDAKSQATKPEKTRK